MDQIWQFSDDQVNTLESWTLELVHLFLDDDFESNVGREQTTPDTVCVFDCICDLAAELLLVEIDLKNWLDIYFGRVHKLNQGMYNLCKVNKRHEINLSHAKEIF